MLAARSAPAPTLDTAGRSDPHLLEAVARWGPHVLQVPDIVDWALYVSSRTCTPPPGLPSPYALLQERYAFDAWSLLVACVLMSRVSSAEVKDRCLSGFFQQCPTPSAFLDTEPATLLPTLKSLGLFPNRLAALVDVTQRFLSMPVFDVGLDGDVKIRGVGEFGYHSYLLFCRGEIFTPADKNLQAFAAWRATQGPAVSVSYYLGGLTAATAAGGGEVAAVKAEPPSPMKKQVVVVKSDVEAEVEVEADDQKTEEVVAEQTVASEDNVSPRRRGRRAAKPAQQNSPKKEIDATTGSPRAKRRPVGDGAAVKKKKVEAADKPDKGARRKEETPQRGGVGQQKTLMHFFTKSS